MVRIFLKWLFDFLKGFIIFILLLGFFMINFLNILCVWEIHLFWSGLWSAGILFIDAIIFFILLLIKENKNEIERRNCSMDHR